MNCLFANEGQVKLSFVNVFVGSRQNVSCARVKSEIDSSNAVNNFSTLEVLRNVAIFEWNVNNKL